MSLSNKRLEGLLRLVSLTKDSEINCEQCLEHVAEFAEQQLVGKTVTEGLQAIEHHLSVCSECKEEYEALKATLESTHEDS